MPPSVDLALDSPALAALVGGNYRPVRDFGVDFVDAFAGGFRDHDRCLQAVEQIGQSVVRGQATPNLRQRLPLSGKLRKCTAP